MAAAADIEATPKIICFRYKEFIVNNTTKNKGQPSVKFAPVNSAIHPTQYLILLDNINLPTKRGAVCI